MVCSILFNISVVFLTSVYSGLSDNIYVVNLQTEQDCEGQTILRVFTSLRHANSPATDVKEDNNHTSLPERPLEVTSTSTNESISAGTELILCGLRK